MKSISEYLDIVLKGLRDATKKRQVSLGKRLLEVQNNLYSTMKLKPPCKVVTCFKNLQLLI